MASLMSDKEEGARQRDCVGRDPEVGQQRLLTRAQRRPLQLERSELPERRLQPGGWVLYQVLPGCFVAAGG